MKNFIKFSVLVFCLSLGWTAKGQFSLLHTIDKSINFNLADQVLFIPDILGYEIESNSNTKEYKVTFYNSE